jgi:iron complex outermembrane recepter protein
VNTLNSSRITRRSLALMMAVGSILAAATAIAAEDQAAPSTTSGGIENVIVTATRREETLQHVPLSVSAISADNLVARGVNTLADLSPGSIPSAVMSPFAGTQSVLAISIRGVGLSDPTQGTVELAVPVYIDGVFLGRGQGLGIDLIEPERVEILRGPQGQLFGRNAEGGVVQYVSRKPSGEFGVRGSVSYGNFDDQRYKLSIDLPKVAGFSVQLSGVKTEHDAYTPQSSQENYPGAATPPSPHADYAYVDSWGARGAIRWNNDGPFTADYTYDYTDWEDSQPYLTWLDVDVVRPAVSPAAPSDKYPDKTFEQLYNEPFFTETSGHGLTLAWAASDSVTLKSITAYRKASRHGSSTLGTPLPAGVSSSGFIYTNAREDVDQDQTSQELQFLGTWDHFDLTAGAIYYKENVTDHRRSFLTGPGFVGPVTFIQPPTVGFCVDNDPCLTSWTEQEAESESYGAYAQASWRPAALDDRLELTVGARYTDDNKDAKRTLNFVPVDQPAHFDAKRVDPAAVIKYNWTDSVQTYLRYSTGYRAGGANVRSSNFTSFQEEENEAWELGMKSQFLESHLQVNLAVFQNTIKGEQLTIQEAPTLNPSLTNTFNSPVDKKVKGAELELFWAALDQLGVGVNFSYMDVPEFREYDNPYTPVVDLTRFYAVSTPETTGSVYLDWTSNPLSVGTLAFHVDYSWSDDYQATPGAQLVSSFLPTYKRPPADSSQLVARLSLKDIQTGSGKMELALWGKNLLDDAGIVYGFDGCAFGGGFCAYRTPPRTYGAEVRFEF